MDTRYGDEDGDAVQTPNPNTSVSERMKRVQGATSSVNENALFRMSPDTAFTAFHGRFHNFQCTLTEKWPRGTECSAMRCLRHRAATPSSSRVQQARQRSLQRYATRAHKCN